MRPAFLCSQKHCATADMVERPTVIHLTRITRRFSIRQIDNDQRQRSSGGRVAATHLFSEPFLVTAVQFRQNTGKDADLMY